MIVKSMRSLAPPMLAILITVVAGAGIAQAAAPVKLVVTRQLGWKVDQTTGKNVCLTESLDKCQPASTSSEAGGFEYPSDIDGAPDGNVYIADRGNNRVQELTAAGEFVLMFGKEVNKNGENVCTVASECEAGKSTTTSGGFSEDQSVAVDPISGNVYVLDWANWRVDEYTSEGRFLLMFGREVNETKDDTPGSTEAEKNLCTAVSGNVCKAGVEAPPGSTEKGAFDFVQGAGDLLAVGGSEHLLYVGDKGRIQLFDEAGEWKSEIKLPPSSSVTSIAVDETTGLAYLVYDRQPVVHVFNLKSEEVNHFEVPPREAGKPLEVPGIALDHAGHLAVWAYEGEDPTRPGGIEQIGILYEASDGQQITEFATPGSYYTGVRVQGATGMGFNGHGELYAVLREAAEIWGYTPRSVAELLNGPASCLEQAEEHETDVTFDCNLDGEVDAWGVPGTEVWFQWGRTQALGEETPRQPISNTKSEGEEETPVLASAVVENVRPNESSFYYRLIGVDDNLDRNVIPPELLVAYPTVSFTTPLVAPKVVGTTTASFVKSTSAVLSGELNPENAESEYFFEFAPSTKPLAEACPQSLASGEKSHCEEEEVTRTATLRSALYRRMGTVLEATNLRAGTRYDVRLVVSNGAGVSIGTVSTFTTSFPPSIGAQTGPATVLSSTSAVITGTVDPDGQPSTYAFELGIDKGPNTQYGVVISAPVAASTTPVPESLFLSGLQPGITYAYRISAGFGRSVGNGYESAATGNPLTFTTPGLPEVLPVAASLEFLPSPPFVFPKAPEPTKKCRPGYQRNKQNKCVKRKAKGRTKKKVRKPKGRARKR